MIKFTARLLVVSLAALLALQAWAYSPAPPKTSVTLSSNGAWRVTIIPKSWGQDVKRHEDFEHALARVERLEGGKWRLVWEKHLVNELRPVDQLLANDGSHLVTFDNWAAMGPNEVDIYNGKGKLVRRIALEDFLPAAYVRQLPGPMPIEWGGKHRLVDGDSVVELQVVEPGRRQTDDPSKRRYVPVRVRLSDGMVLPKAGPAWDHAMAKLASLERERLAKWEEFRRMRTSPLPAPASRDTKDWSRYRSELGERVFEGDFLTSFGGIVLRAPEAEWGEDPDSVAEWIEQWQKGNHNYNNFILVSPTSKRLADVVVAGLGKRKPGSMKGLHLAFVGTAAEGKRVAQAATRVGMQLTAVDLAKPYPGGKLPPATPPDWFYP